MTATDEERALLAAVQANPDDDTVRLVYADWLQENGDEARADLIRVQVEIARLDGEAVARFNEATDWGQCTGISAGWCPNCGDCCCRDPEESKNDADCPLHAPESSHCCLDTLAYRRTRFTDRESALLAANPGWRPACPVCLGVGKVERDVHNGRKRHTTCNECSGAGVVGTFSRGFLSRVDVPRLADVWERCPNCEGRDSPCPLCHDAVWSPTAWAREHLGPHLRFGVLAGVWCGDREPFANSPRHNFGWQPKSVFDRVWPGRDGGEGLRYAVPDPVYALIPRPEDKQASVKRFSDPDAAKLALAAAVAQALREAVTG